ncbi:hypothetical protein L1887_01650 [Cichorium endivia]|nr:hypothetical protein L1887_01650 [Cichorium endivia]
MSEESSSGNDNALVNSVLKKCFTDNQLHPSTSKKPRRSDTLSDELITDEDLPRIAIELQVLVDEARAIENYQNKVKVNEMITKRNEDLFQELLTLRILREKQLVQKKILEVVRRREKLHELNQRANQAMFRDVARRRVSAVKIMKVRCSKPKDFKILSLLISRAGVRFLP